MTEVGRAIREARQRRGLTMQQLADAANVDIGTVGRIERGVTVTPSSAGALQKALGIGLYQRPDDEAASTYNPRLSEATYSDLLGALAARYYGKGPGSGPAVGTD